MGADFSVKNSKYQVTVDLQNGESILALKVKDRGNLQNNGLIHHKRYKYFQLPIQVKNKFSKVKQFHRYLMQNQDKIQVGNKDVTIELDGEKINIPFQNVNQQSKIFCQRQNQQRQQERKQMLESIKNPGGVMAGGRGGINVILNLSGNSPQKIKREDNENYQDCQQALRQITKKIMQKNNGNNKFDDLSDQNLRSLVEILQNQFNQWQKKQFNVPNMSKKKNNDFTKEIDNLRNEMEKNRNEMNNLRYQLQSKNKEIILREGLKNKQIQMLNNQINRINQWCLSPQKIIEMLKKHENEAESKMIGQISDHLNRLSNGTTIAIKIKISDKQSLLRNIGNVVDEINCLRTQMKVLQKQVKQYSQFKMNNKFLLQLQQKDNFSGISEGSKIFQSIHEENQR